LAAAEVLPPLTPTQGLTGLPAREDGSFLYRFNQRKASRLSPYFPLTVRKFCSMLPAFTMEARPVIPVMDAVRAELEVMACRDGLTSK